MICLRNTSCYCSVCSTGELCNNWNEAKTYEEQKKASGPREIVIVHNDSPVSSSVPNIGYETDEFVAAIYQREWYIGKVVDSDKTEVEIDFMEKKKALFHWPTKKDQIGLRCLLFCAQ